MQAISAEWNINVINAITSAILANLTTFPNEYLSQFYDNIFDIIDTIDDQNQDYRMFGQILKVFRKLLINGKMSEEQIAQIIQYGIDGILRKLDIQSEKLNTLILLGEDEEYFIKQAYKLMISFFRIVATQWNDLTNVIIIMAQNEQFFNNIQPLEKSLLISLLQTILSKANESYPPEAIQFLNQFKSS